jgi:hypothetical protein
MMDVKDSKRLSLEERASEQFSMPTEAERALLRAVQEGKNADCRTSEALRTQEEDPSRANEWDDQRTIRAPLLRWLCVDRAAKECVDPYGIRISFAKLSGRLDLSYATLPFPLVCNSCWWPEGVDLTAAALPSLSLEKTWMGPLEGLVGQNGAERLIIVANRAVIRGVVLLRNGFHAEGEVRLYGVEIGGNLECDNGTFKNPGKRALNAERAKIGGAVYLRNGFNAVGEVRLHRAELGGLECDGGSFDNSGQLALNAEGARIRGAVLFRGGFLSEGEVRLFGAETGGNLN